MMSFYDAVILYTNERFIHNQHRTKIEGQHEKYINTTPARGI